MASPFHPAQPTEIDDHFDSRAAGKTLGTANDSRRKKSPIATKTLSLKRMDKSQETSNQ
jgi:hypothetical protein